MKKIFIILLISIAYLTSCSSVDNKQINVEDNMVETNMVEVYTNSVVENPSLEFNNPSVFIGTDFITFFQTCYKLGDFDRMIKFTSSNSINKHGIQKVEQFYKDMNFGYDIKLLNVVNVDGQYIMNYKTSIIATKGIKRFVVIVEGDSCKIVLPNDLMEFCK